MARAQADLLRGSVHHRPGAAAGHPRGLAARGARAGPADPRHRRRAHPARAQGRDLLGAVSAPARAGYLQIIGHADLERAAGATTTPPSSGCSRGAACHLPAAARGAGGRGGPRDLRACSAPRHERWREEVTAMLTRTGVGAAVSILAVSALGFVLVGRPMRRLNEFAKRIGAGDLGGSLQIRQRDEIGELAGEMNRMCDAPAPGQRAAAGGDRRPHRGPRAAAPRRPPQDGRHAGLGHRPRAGHPAQRRVGAGQDGLERRGERAPRRPRAAASSSTRSTASPRSSASCSTSPGAAPPTGGPACWRGWPGRR